MKKSSPKPHDPFLIYLAACVADGETLDEIAEREGVEKDVIHRAVNASKLREELEPITPGVERAWPPRVKHKHKRSPMPIRQYPLTKRR